MPFGDLQVHVCLSILCLLIALSIRTTPKGTGAFWGIPGQSFTKGREQIGEFQNRVFSIHPSSSSPRDGCLLWNSRFKFALNILLFTIIIILSFVPKRGAFLWKSTFIFGKVIRIILTTRKILMVLDTFNWPGAIWGSPDSCCANHSTSLVYSSLLVSS